MVDYLAGQALQGDIDRHRSRLGQTVQKRFDGVIGSGFAWPATTSLAAHLLNTQMGRLIEAHRNQSRSNADLAQEHYALRSGHLFNGIKLALGFVPVIGTAVNLYDGVTHLAAAVDAFARGDTYHGVQAPASVFDSLLFAAMDVVPALAPAQSARQLTRLRQLARPAAQSALSRFLPHRTPRGVRERFDGYAYEQPLSLAGVEPASHGLYRHVYRHARGDFILSQGRIYQVEYDKTYHTLRLSGTRTRQYKQPVAMDASGQWDTHGALYGTLVEGGLAGGGNVAGHLADRLAPWTAPLRDWLPRWWTDHAWRQQQTLMGRIKSEHRRINHSAEQINRLLARYHADDLSVIPELERAMDTLTAQAKNIDEDFHKIAPYLRGNRSQILRKARSDAAEDVCQCAQFQVQFSLHKEISLIQQINAAEARLSALPYEQTAARQALRADIRRLQVQIFENYQRADLSIHLMNEWMPGVQGAHRSQLTRTAEVINRRTTELERARIQTLALTDLITQRKPGHDIAWHYLQGPLKNAENDLLRALYLHVHLREVSPSPGQRNRILQHCIDVYVAYQRRLNSWSASVAQHFDDTYVTLMHQQLDILRARAEHAMTSVSPKTPGTSSRRIFETDDNLLLIGEASTAPGTQARRYTVTGGRGEEQVWEQGSNGKFHRVGEVTQVPWQPAPRQLEAVISEARGRLGNLATHQAKVHGYAQRNMFPADLEFMMTSEADALDLQAVHIEALNGDMAMVRQLRQQALALRERGRLLRINQSLASQTPTEGYLDYLIGQRLDGKPFIDIRKSGALEDLGRRADGRPDFMQEYEVRDLRQDPPTVLWYAHFHYESKAPSSFDGFTKAHLKLPAQRRLGLKWQQARSAAGGEATPIWRGNINKPLARLHFQAV